MRSEGRRDGRGAPPGEEGIRVTRRALLLASGAVTGGVVTGARRSAAARERPVRIRTTEPYRPAVQATDAVSGCGADAVDLRVDTAVRDGADPAADWRADVSVSGSPVFDRTGQGGAEADDWIVHGASVSGRGTLSIPEGTWRECLGPGELRRRWRSDVPIESWCELDPGASPASLPSEFPNDPGDSTLLVRGTRSYQYATGRGGVGHYPVDRDCIRRDGVNGGDGDGGVPIGRFQHVHVRRAVRDDEAVASFLRRYDDELPSTSTAGSAVDP